MDIDIPMDILFQTVITGVVGWFVKIILDSLNSYRNESNEWRTNLDAKVDRINDATQATMRTTLLHYCEKYLSREWITSEELTSLIDMYDKYTALNSNNGFINGYVNRVKQLPIREI